jgi:rhamnose utilization protein RhaD (predicted bifunctional aldolase and dehydrogenase)
MQEDHSADLIALANALGSHPLRLTLHGEGACAAKVSDARFLVSARNVPLSKLAARDLVAVETKKELKALDSEAPPEEPEEVPLIKEEKPEPSLDASIYAYVFTFEGVRFAAHTQPVEVNQILCSPRARQFSDRRTYYEEVIACGASSVLVPYMDAGLPLGREVKRKILLWRDRYKIAPKLLLLQNHGMIVLGETCEEVLRITELTVKAAQIFTGAAMLGGPVFLTPSNVLEIDSIKE